MTIDDDEILSMQYNHDNIDEMNVSYSLKVINDDITSFIVKQAILQIDNLNNDFYTNDSIHASQANGYFTSHDRNQMLDDKEVFYSLLSLKYVQNAVKSLSTVVSHINLSLPSTNAGPSTPFVYLTNDNQQHLAINEVISNFTLNTNQTLAFRIIADHTLDRSKVGNQLLMGLFGEA